LSNIGYGNIKVGNTKYNMLIIRT